MGKENQEYITVCAYCGEAVEEVTYSCGNGWDGNTVCQGCQAIEPDTEEITVEEYEASH